MPLSSAVSSTSSALSGCRSPLLYSAQAKNHPASPSSSKTCSGVTRTVSTCIGVGPAHPETSVELVLNVTDAPVSTRPTTVGGNTSLTTSMATLVVELELSESTADPGAMPTA